MNHTDNTGTIFMSLQSNGLSARTSTVKWLAAIALVCGANSSARAGQDAAPKPALPQDKTGVIEILRTDSGVRYGLAGKKAATPAPTLFVFAAGIEEMQKQPVYSEVGRRLARHGVLYVVVDPPCHGEDAKPGEPPELKGWRSRVEDGDPLFPSFVDRARAVLDDLIEKGFTDADRVMACGTSRGGLSALHFAAAEPRVKAVAAFSPVTDPRVLTEFQGVKNRKTAELLNATNLVGRLAGRPVWISIGNNDHRVDTDSVVGFTRELVQSGAKANSDPQGVVPVELIVGAVAGHRAIPHAHQLAAEWFEQTVKLGPEN